MALQVSEHISVKQTSAYTGCPFGEPFNYFDTYRRTVFQNKKLQLNN